MKKITVLLAEDHMIVREGLRALLKLEDDIEVIAEAENGRQTVNLTRKLSPAVVVMDIAMPLLNGMEATRQILHAQPGTKVLILSAHSDEAYIEEVMALGAAGYLIKQTAASALAIAVRAVADGKSFFSPAVSRRLSQYEKVPGRNTARKPRCAQLTSRETEVLQLVAEGMANKQIAAELEISIKTVEKHRQGLMDKLNVHDTAGLTRHAIAAGIIESSVQSTTD
jgi:DNA-binding NarL/FixJ family response regulator